MQNKRLYSLYYHTYYRSDWNMNNNHHELGFYESTRVTITFFFINIKRVDGAHICFDVWVEWNVNMARLN